MARDIFCRDDLLNVLRCTHVAAEGVPALLSELGEQTEHAPQSDILIRAYRSGFERALVAVGLAFGLEASNRCKEWKKTDSLHIQTRKRLP